MAAPKLLVPPLNRKAPIKDLERLWLNCTCAYDQLDENLMADTDWDMLTVELREREAEWSPYFRHSVPRDCIISSTSSGIDWGRPNSVQKITLQALRADMPRRIEKLRRMCQASPAIPE